MFGFDKSTTSWYECLETASKMTTHEINKSLRMGGIDKSLGNAMVLELLTRLERKINKLIEEKERYDEIS